MVRASRSDRAYFERVARQNERLVDLPPPTSLAEMFDRLETIRRTHGALARAGLAGGEGDLGSHLAYLERVRRIGGRGTHRS